VLHLAARGIARGALTSLHQLGRQAYFASVQAPSRTAIMTRPRWSKPLWSVSVMLYTPCVPISSRVCSSPSRSAARNSFVPGFALFAASGIACCSSSPAS